MTVFKGFLIITKRNLLMVFMYLAIFLTIGILASGSDSNTSGSGFHAQALTIGVVDHDGGVLSKGLSTYLSQYHTIRQMPDDTAKLQDALFNRNVSYIVTIPKDFKVSCLREHQELPVSKIPGSTDGYYVDQQINTYLNQARVLTDSGYSDKEAAAYILKHADSSSHVTMLKSASSEKTPGYGYMYQYLPYVSRWNGKHVAIVVTVIGTAAAIVYPMDNITDFLYLIGSVFAPMIAIQIADFFLLKQDKSSRAVYVPNMIIWVIGFVVYRILMNVDMPVGNTLPDMVITIVLCLIAGKLIPEKNQKK